MGVIKFFSSSSYDEKPIVRTIYETVTKVFGKGINPNPKNFEIKKSLVVNEFLIMRVLYPDCKNYEGLKILLYDKGVTDKNLLEQKSIDPHFSKNIKFISPIARFIPSAKGWNMAVKLARTLKTKGEVE